MWNKLLAKLKSWFYRRVLGRKREKPWLTGPREIVPSEELDEWRLVVRLRNQDMTRPNGKPERIWVKLWFEGGFSYMVYAMIDNRNAIRARGKGDGLNLHVSSWIYAPIPSGEFELVVQCSGGDLVVLINGGVCPKSQIKIGARRLKRVVWCPDAGRPAGIERQGLRLEAGNGS